MQLWAVIELGGRAGPVFCTQSDALVYREQQVLDGRTVAVLAIGETAEQQPRYVPNDNGFNSLRTRRDGVS